jgi:hypothetical protein
MKIISQQIKSTGFSEGSRVEHIDPLNIRATIFQYSGSLESLMSVRSFIKWSFDREYTANSLLVAVLKTVEHIKENYLTLVS